MTENERQERIHEALQRTLPDLDDQVLAGWVVVFETVDALGGRPACGHVYGPAGMTTWRARGLCDWALEMTVRPDEEEGT